MDLGSFFGKYGFLILLVVLLVFMWWSSRRRAAKQKAEHEAKARQTVPGAEVLLQGGLYGTIVSYDPDDLDKPAVVELAPGVEIRVHSQAILRVVTPSENDDAVEPDEPARDLPADGADVHVETAEETARRLGRDDQDSTQA